MVHFERIKLINILALLITELSLADLILLLLHLTYSHTHWTTQVLLSSALALSIVTP